MIKTVIISIALLSFFSMFSQPLGYSYGKQILVDGTKVSGTVDLVDFTMLVSMTDLDLRSVSNGGHVESENGYDILFTYADCGITTLVHQIENYNPVTGNFIAWVKVNKLNATANTNLHMYYGNSSVTTTPSSSLAWHSDVGAVYHLSNNDFTDGTSNAMNATNISTGVVTGQIGEGRSFNGSSQYLNVSESGTTSLDVTTLTMSAWVYPTNYNVVSDRGMIVNKESRYEMGLRDNVGSIQAASQPGCWRWAGTEVVPLNTWSKVTVVYAGGAQKHYVNGVWIENFNDCSNPLGTNNADLRIGARGGDGSPGSYFRGNIDEVKIVGREESADWIATEYTNQNDPSTFYTKSIEMTASNLCFTLPIELSKFVAKKDNDNVILEWVTLSEIDNNYFEIERSSDYLNWKVINKVNGAGNSISEINYKEIDYSPLMGVSYYRLKQVDFNGSYSYSSIQSINRLNALESLNIYPNPVKSILTVELDLIGLYQVKVLNNLGQEIKVDHTNEGNKFLINTNSLLPGIYFVEVSNYGAKKMEKFIKE